MMTTKNRYWLLALIIVILALGAYFYSSDEETSPEVTPAATQAMTETLAE